MESQTDNTFRTSLIPLRGFLETHKTNAETKKIPPAIKKCPLIWTTGRISSVDHYLVRSERVLVVRCGQTIWRNGCVPRALGHYTHVDQQSVHTHVIISPTPLLARDVITLCSAKEVSISEENWSSAQFLSFDVILRRYVFEFNLKLVFAIQK